MSSLVSILDFVKISTTDLFTNLLESLMNIERYQINNPKNLNLLIFQVPWHSFCPCRTHLREGEYIPDISFFFPRHLFYFSSVTSPVTKLLVLNFLESEKRMESYLTQITYKYLNYFNPFQFWLLRITIQK